MQNIIAAKDNPKIKQYRKLASQKKFRAESGMFVVEGMINCVDLIRSGADIVSVFYTEDAVERYRGQLKVSLIENFDSDKKFLITPAVADTMSDVGHTQGAFAVCKKFDIPLVSEALDSRGKYLVLDAVQDPGNLGTMIRTAAAVGIEGIILTGNTVELYNPKVVRSAMASMPLVKLFIENDFQRVVNILSDSDIITYAAVVSGGESASETVYPEGCAVVIGNEGRGLPDSHVALCARRVTIKMKGSLDSLNAAAAATILLWEMSGRGK